MSGDCRADSELLARGQEALVACIPRATEPYMTKPPLADDSGVLASTAHDLPGPDADAVVLTVAIPVACEINPLVPASNREGPSLSGECRHAAVVDRDLLTVAHHVASRDAQEVVADRA